MKDILDKLSSYNIFNNLLPGVIFVIFVEKLTSFHLAQNDPVLGAFLYYFLGSVLSRIGSLLIEPLLRKFNFVEFSPYEDFIRACKFDPKIEVLSEANNMYRTICALMISVGAIIVFEHLTDTYPALANSLPWFAIFGLFILHLLSYRKQTAYISKRIEVSNHEHC